MVEGGIFFDPLYEVFLQKDGKLETNELPYLSLPQKASLNLEVSSETKEDMIFLISKLGPRVSQSLSELILSENHELTFILRDKDGPISVFLGKKNWSKKTESLSKILGHFAEKSQRPSVINLTNHKKVVVKFPGRS